MINLKINLTENQLKDKALAIRLKTQDDRSFVLFWDGCGKGWKGEDEDDIIGQIFNSRKEDINCEIDDYDKAEDYLFDEIKEEVEEAVCVNLILTQI